MQSSYRLFKILGISVELHFTFLLFMLFALFSSVNYFYLLVLIFLIVLIHELCHSIAALSFGIKVPRITLTPIGGLASLEVPEDPKKEFIISLAGPMSNFVMAFIAVLVAVLIQAPVDAFFEYRDLEGVNPSNIAPLLGAIFWINMVLGLFNIMPGFPMDGGRVFRAFMVVLKKDYIKATEIAVTVGKIFALLLIMWGILDGDFFRIMIGLFLIFAGGQELEVLKLKRYLRGLTVDKVAAPNPRYVEAETYLSDFMQKIASPEQEHYPVVDSGHRVIGVLGLTDLKDVSEEDFHVLQAKNVLRRDISVVSAAMDVEPNLEMLLSKDHFFVEDQGRIIGYLTPSHLIKMAKLYGLGYK